MAVMLGDYGCDDMTWLEEHAEQPGTVTVKAHGRTRRDQSERARELLEQAKARIVGVALTNAPRESGAAEYYG